MAELRAYKKTGVDITADFVGAMARGAGRLGGMQNPAAYGMTVSNRIRDAIYNTPVLGLALQSKDYAKRGEYGPAAAMAGLAVLSAAPVGKTLGEAAGLAKVMLGGQAMAGRNMAVKTAARVEARREETKRIAKRIAKTQAIKAEPVASSEGHAPMPDAGFKPSPGTATTGKIPGKDLSGYDHTVEPMLERREAAGERPFRAPSRTESFQAAQQHWNDSHMTAHAPAASGGRIGFGNENNQKAAQAARLAKAGK